MSKVIRLRTGTQPSGTHVQSLVIQLEGVTAGDYLAWVRDPEPLALDHGLRLVVIATDPLGQLVIAELVWVCQPPRTPSAAAVVAGFPLIPEVVALDGATCSAYQTGTCGELLEVRAPADDLGVRQGGDHPEGQARDCSESA